MIYLDNAATTFPKPSVLIKKMNECINEYCGNPGRSGHQMSLRTAEEIYETRKEIANLINCQDPQRIIFTDNTTDSLNLGIKGALEPGDHVITTSMEHNSVLRPIIALAKNNVEYTIIRCKKDGTVTPEDIKKAIKPNTKLIVCTHASNITGTIFPIKEIGEIAKKYNILFLVDAAQSGGIIEVDSKKNNIDMLAMPGHKGLLGPQGTGFLYVKEGIILKHLKEGGTGTESSNLFQPFEMPEGYESGTLNAPGIIGLGETIKFIKKQGINEIKRHEDELTNHLYEELKQIKKVKLYGPTEKNNKTGIVLFNIDKMNGEEVSYQLDKNFSIASRAGYHCAGMAHETIGTQESGAVRLSIGYFNTMKEIQKAVFAVKKISEK